MSRRCGQRVQCAALTALIGGKYNMEAPTASPRKSALGVPTSRRFPPQFSPFGIPLS